MSVATITVTGGTTDAGGNAAVSGSLTAMCVGFGMGAAGLFEIA